MEEKENFSQETKPSGCFICNGTHKARGCLKKGKMNAFITAKKDHNKSKTPA